MIRQGQRKLGSVDGQPRVLLRDLVSDRPSVRDADVPDDVVDHHRWPDPFAIVRVAGNVLRIDHLLPDIGQVTGDAELRPDSLHERPPRHVSFRRCHALVIRPAPGGRHPVVDQLSSAGVEFRARSQAERGREDLVRRRQAAEIDAEPRLDPDLACSPGIEPEVEAVQREADVVRLFVGTVDGHAGHDEAGGQRMARQASVDRAPEPALAGNDTAGALDDGVADRLLEFLRPLERQFLVNVHSSAPDATRHQRCRAVLAIGAASGGPFRGPASFPAPR